MAFTGSASAQLRWFSGIIAFATALPFSHLFPLWFAFILAPALAGIPIYLTAAGRSAVEQAADEACGVACRL